MRACKICRDGYLEARMPAVAALMSLVRVPLPNWHVRGCNAEVLLHNAFTVIVKDLKCASGHG